MSLFFCPLRRGKKNENLKTSGIHFFFSTVPPDRAVSKIKKKKPS
jgi:hypothetical protein